MSQESLRELLSRVHERLSSGGAAIDADSRALLAGRFEAEHPGLAETLRELIDALGKAGI